MRAGLKRRLRRHVEHGRAMQRRMWDDARTFDSATRDARGLCATADADGRAGRSKGRWWCKRWPRPLRGRGTWEGVWWVHTLKSMCSDGGCVRSRERERRHGRWRSAGGQSGLERSGPGGTQGDGTRPRGRGGRGELEGRSREAEGSAENMVGAGDVALIKRV